MDRLVDEAEGLVAEGSGSVCSSSSGRLEPPTDQQINLLNSITASDLSGASQFSHTNKTHMHETHVFTWRIGHTILLEFFEHPKDLCILALSDSISRFHLCRYSVN